jgi:serpin B
MAEALELHGLNLDEVNRANAELRQALEGLDPQVQLAIANSLWLKHGETFKPEFVQRGRSFYDAEVANFGDGDAPVINAIYFKGSWTAQFDKARSRSQPHQARRAASS